MEMEIEKLYVLAEYKYLCGKIYGTLSGIQSLKNIKEEDLDFLNNIISNIQEFYDNDKTILEYKILIKKCIPLLKLLFEDESLFINFKHLNELLHECKTILLR